MGKRVDEAQRKFEAAMSGNGNESPRWQTCVDHVNGRLHLATGALYVRRRFDRKSKDDAVRLVRDLRTSFHRMIEDVSTLNLHFVVNVNL